MAQSGTITATRDQFRNLLISIIGITEGSNSPVFQGHGYPIGSYTAQGTFGSGTPSLQLQGSNDGGSTWFAVGSPLTATGAASMIGTDNEIFQLYQFALTGGDGTTSISIYVFMAATFG